MWKVFNLPSNSTETLNSECSCLPSAQRQLGFPHLRWRSTKEPGSISRNALRLRMSLPRRSRSWSPGISTSNTNGRQRGSQGYCNICKNDLGQIRLGTRRSFSGLVGQTQARCEIAATNGGQPVHIVAHSMGGLMARAALKEFGDELWPIVGRIVFIGTPHYGSPAIAGYLKNHLWGWDLMAVLGLYLSRATFRSFWGVLSLLPAPAGVYPGTRSNDNPKWQPPASRDFFYAHPCANFALYDASDWDLGLAAGDMGRLQSILDAVAAFHRELHAWHADPRELPQEYCDRMLTITGVGYKCLFRLEYQSKAGGLWESVDKVTGRITGDPHRDGDGRVPVASATLGRIALRYVKGVDAGLTNIPAVYGDVFRWLKGEPLSSLAETGDDALGSHLSAITAASEAPHLDGTAKAEGDDPGYWRTSEVTASSLGALDQAVERGAVPEFNQLKLL